MDRYISGTTIDPDRIFFPTHHFPNHHLTIHTYWPLQAREASDTMLRAIHQLQAAQKEEKNHHHHRDGVWKRIMRKTGFPGNGKRDKRDEEDRKEWISWTDILVLASMG